MKIAAVLALCLLPTLAFAVEEQTKLYDLNAETIPGGTTEIGLFWGRISRGVGPDLQLSTHLAGDLLGVVNGFAKYRLVDRTQLRASIEGGFVWGAFLLAGAESGPKPLLLFLPLELRATLPVRDELELHLGFIYRQAITSGSGQQLGVSSLRVDATLARHDARGAWLLAGRFPLFSRATVSLESLLGKSNVSGALALDDLDSWSLVAGRDLTFGERGHIRLNLGYRATEGILFYESIGHVVVGFDMYWR